MLWAAGVAAGGRRPRLVGALLAVAAALVGAAPAEAKEPPPRVTMLAPDWAATVNPTQVQIAALVRGRDAVLRLDGRIVRRLRTSCPEQVVSTTLPAARLTDGTHIALVTSGRRRAGSGFRVDRTAPPPARNRIEAAATPAHLACLTRTQLRLQPGRTIDLTRDRVVLERAGRITATTPRAFGLVRTGPGRYSFPRITGPFTLRIGDDWGALDASGRRVARKEAVADTARAATADIGPAGGSVTAGDAGGVRITLEVPPGSLASPVRITLTPLASGAPAGGFSQPGLRLEPHGLVFARPAQLTLDYSGTAHRVEAAERVQLVTSPLTTLPLPGSASPERGRVVGFLSHFSETVGGVTREQYAELKAWADPILQAGETITFGELELLLGFATVQIETGGCGDNCVDFAAVASSVDAAVDALAEEQCAADVGSPDRTLVRRWLLAESAVQVLGGSSGVAGDCARRIVDALVVRAQGSAEALADAAEAAEEAGDPQLADYVRNRARDNVRARMNAARARCGQAGDARSQLLALVVDAALVDDPALQNELAAAIAGCGEPPTPSTTPAPAPAPSEPADGGSPAGGGSGSGSDPAGPSAFVAPTGMARTWTALPEDEGGVPNAPECAADMLNPTLQAAADWHATLAAVPEGTDDQPVRGCLEEVVRGLVNAAIAAANDQQTIATLQALADLEQAATAWGLAAEGDRAGDALLEALLLVGEQAASTCAADPDGAADRLLFALAWAPLVATRDPGFAAFVQEQLDACEDQPLLRVLSGGREPLWETASRCSVQNVDTFGRRGARLPVTVATGTGPASIGMTLEQPTATEVTVDLALHQISTGAGDLTGLWCLASLVVIPSVSGTLQVSLAPGFGGGELFGTLETITARIGGTQTWEDFDAGEPLPSATAHVDAGAVALVELGVTAPSCGAFPGCASPVVYHGRWATIDFTPDP